MNQPLHLPMARENIDRDTINRDREHLLTELWSDPETLVLVLHDSKALLHESTDGPIAELRYLSPIEVPNPQLLVYLGQTKDAYRSTNAGRRVVLAEVSADEAARIEPNPDHWHFLRRSGAGLSERDSGLFATAVAVANWHASHKHCAKCGSATKIEKSGWVRRCLNDNTELYPRTDPAIIASVIDSKGRILLGSQGSWEANRWSVLAGYVEPGESLSAAVVREIYEEAGVRVINPQYLGDQPWPFPYSLMVAFTAQADPEFEHFELAPDGVEIARLRWFSREEFASEASSLKIPPKSSIARALIERWFGGPIENLANPENLA